MDVKSEFDFSDLTVFEQPVTMPDGRKFVLREATEEAALAYRYASLRGMEMVVDDDSGDRTTRRMEAIAEVEPLLVQLCLWDGDRRNPTLDYVKGQPSRVVKALFTKVKDVSDLGETEDLPTLEKQLAKLNARIAKARGRDADPKAVGSGTRPASS